MPGWLRGLDLLILRLLRMLCLLRLPEGTGCDFVVQSCAFVRMQLAAPMRGGKAIQDPGLPWDSTAGVWRFVTAVAGLVQAEILKGVERPRSPKSIRDGSSDTHSSDSWGRMHGSNSDHPLAHVHITIGNSIQDKLHLDDMISPVPSAAGGGIQPLDSIPENMRSVDTIDEGTAAAAPDSDTLEMLLPSPYSIEGGVGGMVDGREWRRGSGRGGPRRPPRPPPPRRDAGQASDGMFHVSMDRSDIESLPVLDSSAGPLLPSSLPNSVRSSSGRYIFSPAAVPEVGPSVREVARRWPPTQSTQQSSGSSDGAFDPALCDLAKSMPLTETSAAASAAVPQQPLATVHASDSVENSGAISGSMASPYGGGAASLGNTADFSPTLPPLTSPFTFDFMLRQRSGARPNSGRLAVAAGYAAPSPFDAEPAVAEAAEAAAALAGSGATAGLRGAFNVDAEFPPLEAGMSASFRTRTDAPPLSPQLASPFDGEPAAHADVSLDNGGTSVAADQAECKTAPFFRPADAASVSPDAAAAGAYVPTATGAVAAAYSPAPSVRGTNDTVSPTSIGEDAPAHLSVHSNAQSLSMSSTIAHGAGESRSPTKALPPRTDASLPEMVGQRRSDGTGLSAVMGSQPTGASIPRLSASFGASFGGSSFDAEPPIASLNTFAVQQFNTPFSRPPSQTERTRRMGSNGSAGRRGHPGRTYSNGSRTVSNASRLNFGDIIDGEAALAPILDSSFDAEPTAASAAPAPPPLSARAMMDRTPSSASLSAHGFADATVHHLVSGFDAEPSAARRGGAAVVVPAFVSSFDAEPGAAAADTPRLPSFAADAPQLPVLTSLFDFEPVSSGTPAGAPSGVSVAPALASMFDAEPAGATGGPPAHVTTQPTPFALRSRSSSRSSMDRMRSSSRHASHDHSSTLSRVVSNARSRLGAAYGNTPATPSPLNAEQQWQIPVRSQSPPAVPVVPDLPTSFAAEPSVAFSSSPSSSHPAQSRGDRPYGFTAEQRLTSHALRMDSSGLAATSSYTPSPVHHHRTMSRASVFDIDPPSSVGSMTPSGTPRRARTPPLAAPVRDAPREPPREASRETPAAEPQPGRPDVAAIMKSVRDSIATASGNSSTNSRSPHEEVMHPEQQQYPGFTGLGTPSPGVSSEDNVAMIARLAAEQSAAASTVRSAAAAAAAAATAARRADGPVHRGSPFYSGQTVSPEDLRASIPTSSGRPISLPNGGQLTPVRSRPATPPAPWQAESVRTPVPPCPPLPASFLRRSFGAGL